MTTCGIEAAGAVTAKQAHELPVAELSRLVLGEAGAALVTEVERPTWYTGPLAAPLPPGADPSRDPPPLTQIAFYTRPKGWPVTGWAPWSALCYRTKIRVDFGVGGAARDITTETVFAAGFSGPYAGRGTADDASRLDQACPALPFRRFFEAPNPWSAENVIGAVDLLHRTLPQGPVPNLTLTCLPAPQPCPAAADPRLAAWIAVDRIMGVEAAACDTGRSTAPPLSDQADACYNVQLNSSDRLSNRLFLALHVADGSITIRRARLDRMIVVS